MKKMKKRVAVSCYEFQIVGLERSKRGLRGRPTVRTNTHMGPRVGWFEWDMVYIYIYSGSLML